MKKLSFSVSFLFCLLIPVNSYVSAQVKAKNELMHQSHCSPEKTTDIDWYTSERMAPKFKDLDGIDFRITTSSPEAQEYFNQGLMLSYGFNHAEAARSFYQATRLDPDCAMGYWGYAYVLGPNYNGGMEPDNFERAFDASQKAVKLAADVSPVERDLILALSDRYIRNPPEDRSFLDRSYSEAMKKVYEKYPDVPDVGALYAESLMDLHPWDLYEKRTKQPKEWTPELINVLEHLIKISPEHPGAHHFYIHAVEASANPERGLESARLLETLVPGAGHLVHMPSHIYINTGDYHLGTLANKNAVKVDEAYITTCHAQGVYPLAYFPHNYHFLAATATLEGNKTDAWLAARKIHEKTSVDIMKEPGWGTLQHYHTIPLYVAVKFALWDTILAWPESEKELVYPRAVTHYARGMAWLGKKEVSRARAELSELKKLAKDSALHSITIWDINSTYELMQIAVNVLEGELAGSMNNYDEAVNYLKRAVEIEDKLNYDEPPDWFFSVRHNLGNIMLRNGNYAEAESIYNEDLQTWKRNGWALHGLYTALSRQEKKEEAIKVKQQFEDAWQHADYVLSDIEPVSK